MKTLEVVVVMIVAMALLVPSSAMAQVDEDGEVRTKFVNFEDMLFEGGVVKPSGERYTGKDKAKFATLSKLKKSMLPQIQESVEALD